MIFPLKVTRGIQRSSPGRGHVCGTKPCLFPEARIFLTASPAVSSVLGTFPPLLYANTRTGYSVSRFVYRPKSRNECPLHRVVGSRWLCHTQVGRAKVRPPGCSFSIESEQEKQNLEYTSRDVFKPQSDSFKSNSAWLCLYLAR